MTDLPAVAYKVLTSPEMAVLIKDGHFTGSQVDLADGFIHLSTAGQLAMTVEKHFAGQTGLFITAVDLGALGDAVRWEMSRGGALFPHLYAPLPLSATVACGPLERDEAGEPRLPNGNQPG